MRLSVPFDLPRQARPAGAAAIPRAPRWVLAVAVAFALFPATTVRAQVTATDEIRLRPGDVLNVRVWRKPELSGEFVVAADGSVGDPFYSTVRVAGLTVAAARERIRDRVATIEAEPLVWVEPVLRVVVMGEVRQPSLHPVKHPTTIAQAIAQAGGPTEMARLDRVQLVREGSVQVVDLRDPAAPLARTTVLSGDEIIVPRRSTRLRDALVPISTLASLASLIVTISNR